MNTKLHLTLESFLKENLENGDKKFIPGYKYLESKDIDGIIFDIYEGEDEEYGTFYAVYHEGTCITEGMDEPCYDIPTDEEIKILAKKFDIF